MQDRIFITILLFVLVFLNKFEIGKRGERYLVDLFSFPLRMIASSDYSKGINVIVDGRSEKIEKENKELKQKIKRLKQKIVKLEEAAQENKRLRGLLSFKNRKYSSILAQVIGKSSDNWRKTIIINKGKKCGIIKDMAVISQEGLVGRVVDAGLRNSKVMLITDYSSKVDAFVKRTRDQGIVEGNLLSLRMKYINKHSDVQKGDTIISSGMGGIYPKGLIIGEVKKINKDRQGLYINAQILPAVNLHKLEEVLCLKEETLP